MKYTVTCRVLADLTICFFEFIPTFRIEVSSFANIQPTIISRPSAVNIFMKNAYLEDLLETIFCILSMVDVTPSWYTKPNLVQH
jgi:hypothetical protein